MFKALIVKESAPGKFTREIGMKSIADLPPGEVLIRVFYSSLNYKDALSASGHKGVTRRFPHTPGIDAAGVVEQSTDPRFLPDDEVLVTGFDLGMNTSGGFGEYIRVPADWVVKLPSGLSLKESMIFGTAGFTAALSILKLQKNHVFPDSGPILVTGATGGVGSMAVAILGKIGYSVTAATGKIDQKAYLLEIGASEVIHRNDLEDTSGRPLLKGRWAGAVDTVGGNYLVTALKSVTQHGAVTCCGLTASPEFATTVYPFILRGISLIGIDSAEQPPDSRPAIWEKLAGEWKPDGLEDICIDTDLNSLEKYIASILKGGIRGRVVLTHSSEGND